MASLVSATYTTNDHTDSVVQTDPQIDLIESLEEAKRASDVYLTVLMSDEPNAEPRKKHKEA